MSENQPSGRFDFQSHRGHRSPRHRAACDTGDWLFPAPPAILLPRAGERGTVGGRGALDNSRRSRRNRSRRFWNHWRAASSVAFGSIAAASERVGRSVKAQRGFFRASIARSSRSGSGSDAQPAELPASARRVRHPDADGSAAARLVLRGRFTHRNRAISGAEVAAVPPHGRNRRRRRFCRSQELIQTKSLGTCGLIVTTFGASSLAGSCTVVMNRGLTRQRRRLQSAVSKKLAQALEQPAVAQPAWARATSAEAASAPSTSSNSRSSIPQALQRQPPAVFPVLPVVQQPCGIWATGALQPCWRALQGTSIGSLTTASALFNFNWFQRRPAALFSSTESSTAARGVSSISIGSSTAACGLLNLRRLFNCACAPLRSQPALQQPPAEFLGPGPLSLRFRHGRLFHRAAQHPRIKAEAAPFHLLGNFRVASESNVRGAMTLGGSTSATTVDRFLQSGFANTSLVAAAISAFVPPPPLYRLSQQE